ncbi:hypothetical protein KMZ32_02460 [Phycicoccus sp. MAQZ13P-2]|uniref:DUF6318 family protein n=1 Tax=Phycicoccus mangrovi TaxID=2840470 RepID=UPI001C00451D|nr:DUF6318 family protein [Phycicoccus mangrovi]MBT9254861.1 hypothetical protein [Phycicoccus mangrovi]MBT9272934.1 hypothetical protein [Phycicoccus mangrovi]
MTRGTRWVVAGVALGSVLLAGCETSGDDDPSPTPTPSVSSVSPSSSPSASPSPSPSASGPEIPAAAREQTPAGAEAYVEYFFDQFNVAWTKPQPGLIKSLSDPQCQFCKKTETTATRLAADKQRYKSDPARLQSVDVFGGAPAGQQFTQVRLVQNRVAIVDEGGDVVRIDERKELDYYVTLRWKSDRWWLLELEKTS